MRDLGLQAAGRCAPVLMDEECIPLRCSPPPPFGSSWRIFAARFNGAILRPISS